MRRSGASARKQAPRMVRPDVARLRGAAGLRNRIAHGYAGVDHARLHDEFTQGVATLRRFLAAVAEAAGL
jgi:uncharacterized protein YutE (UPF0331/DUF86 family)